MPSFRHHPLSTLPLLPPITNPHTHLLSSLTHILTKYPPTFPPAKYSFSGLYYGPTSIAFLFLRLEQVYPGLVVCGRECKSWAGEYLRLSIMDKGGDGDDGAGLSRSLSLKWLLGRKKISQKICGVGCESLARLVVYAVLNMNEELATEVCRSVGEVVNTPPEFEQEDTSSDEWLYGRSGFLYFLRFLKYSFPPSSSRTRFHSLIDTTIQQTIARIIQTYQYYRDATNTTNNAPKEIAREGNKGKWKWHGKEYFGAVHGLAGITAQVVLSCDVVSSCPSSTSSNDDENGNGNIIVVPVEIQEAIEELLDLQIKESSSGRNRFKSGYDSGGGNWPSSRESMSRNDRLVQICHGAPGIVISLMAIAKVISRRQQQAELGAEKAGEGSQEEENPVEKVEMEERVVSASSITISTTSFTTLSHLFLTRILLACEISRKEVISSRGLLTKQPSLCHGTTGNALAFLPTPPPSLLSDPPNPPSSYPSSLPLPSTENHNHNFHTMKTFLSYTTREFLNQEGKRWFFRSDDEDVEGEDVIDEEMGLWTGEAGRAWGFVVLEEVGKEVERGGRVLGWEWEWESRWGGRIIGFNDV